MMRGVPIEKYPQHSFFRIAIITLLLTALRLYYLYLEPFGIYADEAQYWTWSTGFEWGYYSKPPVVAWLIAFTGQLCGDGSFCIRLSSPILHLLTSWLIYGIGSTLYNPRIGFWSALIYLTLPGVTVSSAIMSTDPPLLFCWALALYAFVRGVNNWHIKWWILAGLAAGFGMLSKYSMLFFLPSVVLFFLLTPKNTVYFYSIKFWIAVIIALLVYLPNFLWNFDNDFVSYMHTQDNANITGPALHVDKLLEFFAAQFGVFGPILFGSLLALFYFSRKMWKKENDALLLYFILPLLIAILLISLLSRAHANWAAPVYIAATVLVTSRLIHVANAGLLKLSLILHLTVAALFYHFDTTTTLLGITIDQDNDPFRRVRGVEKFADEVKEVAKRYPASTLLSDERKTVANLMYHLRDDASQPATVYKWNADGITHDHYDLTTDMNSKVGEDFLLVTRLDSAPSIFPYFRYGAEVQTITIPLYAGYARTFRVYYLEDFQGY